VSALRYEGHDAWLQEPREGEYGSGGIVTDPLVEVSMFLWEHVSEETIGAIVALAFDRLRRRSKRKRNGVIYGPDGEVLRRFGRPARRVGEPGTPAP
jgi:hypothetical protein